VNRQRQHRTLGTIVTPSIRHEVSAITSRQQGVVTIAHSPKSA
jgi:hypothetical protein